MTRDVARVREGAARRALAQGLGIDRQSRGRRLDDRGHPLAEHPGDAVYRSAVQQALLRLTPNTQGRDQRITFSPVADQPAGTKTLKLTASSDAGLPISYYVREGPTEIEGDTLRFTALPPRAKLPMEITVVAWQWGRSGDDPVKTAEPVTQTFRLLSNQ